MKFLANAPMMQFLMHPLHRNDLHGSNYIYIEFFSGGALTPAEIAFSQSGSVVLTTGFLNAVALSNNLKTTRTLLATGAPVLLPEKSHYGATDIKALLLSQRSQLLTFAAAGTAALAMIVIYNGGNTNGGSRLAFLCSVGDLSSGAEVRMENPVIANGGRYRMNDIIINIAGLLGE